MHWCVRNEAIKTSHLGLQALLLLAANTTANLQTFHLETSAGEVNSSIFRLLTYNVASYNTTCFPSKQL